LEHENNTLEERAVCSVPYKHGRMVKKYGFLKQGSLLDKIMNTTKRNTEFLVEARGKGSP
jgi:hypothetical protein